MKTQIVYFLYDGRYNPRKDRALVYCVSDTLEEANDDKKDFPDAVIVKVTSKHIKGNEYEIIKEEKV